MSDLDIALAALAVLVGVAFAITLITSAVRAAEIERLQKQRAQWVYAQRAETERLRAALKAVIDLSTVVPDHPHGGIYPPYLEWHKVAGVVRAALAEPPVASIPPLPPANPSLMGGR